MVPPDYRYELIHKVTNQKKLLAAGGSSSVFHVYTARIRRTSDVSKRSLNYACVRVRVVFETSNVQVKGFGRKSGLTYEDEQPNKVVGSCKLEFVTREVTWSFTVF